MAKLALAPELTWLRAYVAEPCEEIDISVEAEASMKRDGIVLSELMSLLRTGSITKSVKQYEGADITVQGRNCDDKMLEAVCWIECNTIQVRVLNVYKL
jgi:hypothetical protein